METQNEAFFIRGYNNGYLLEKYEPTLLAMVLQNISPSTVYVSGLAIGQKQYQQERTEKELKHLGEFRRQDLDRGREID